MKTKLLRRYGKAAGLPPGSIASAEIKNAEETKLELMQYNQDEVISFRPIKTDDIGPNLKKDMVNWVRLSGYRNLQTFESLAEKLSISNLIIEDILNTEHLPKAEDTGSDFFLMLKDIRYEKDTDQIIFDHYAFLINNESIISFQEYQNKLFNNIINRIEKKLGKARGRGHDYLLYLLFDRIVDDYFIVMDEIDTQIQEKEQKIISGSSDQTLTEIIDLRKTLLHIRQQITPLLEIFRGRDLNESVFIQKITRNYLRDIKDHVLHLYEHTSNLLEHCKNLIDLHNSEQANRLNEIMKTLTVIATIFIPLTFIAGIYGMNFKNMPELEWKYGYPLIMGIMVLIGLVIFWFMKRKKFF